MLPPEKCFVLVLVIAVVGVLVYLIYDFVTSNTSSPSVASTTQHIYPASTVPRHASVEAFADPTMTPSPTAALNLDSRGNPDVDPNMNPDMGHGVTSGMMPSECYPKEVLTSVDLLPGNPDSKWAQVVPSGQGSLGDQNYLTAGHHVGINTIGQSKRNGNRQFRSEPHNPQIKVGPWNQTTISPDINRKPLEIG